MLSMGLQPQLDAIRAHLLPKAPAAAPKKGRGKGREPLLPAPQVAPAHFPFVSHLNQSAAQSGGQAVHCASAARKFAATWIVQPVLTQRLCNHLRLGNVWLTTMAQWSLVTASIITIVSGIFPLCLLSISLLKSSHPAVERRPDNPRLPSCLHRSCCSQPPCQLRWRRQRSAGRGTLSRFTSLLMVPRSAAVSLR